jgi:hypothetical protein
MKLSEWLIETEECSPPLPLSCYVDMYIKAYMLVFKLYISAFLLISRLWYFSLHVDIKALIFNFYI